jgi:hypothetical protein
LPRRTAAIRRHARTGPTCGRARKSPHGRASGATALPAGQVEFLDEAAGFLHEPCLREVAERRLPGLVAEAESTGGYRWTNGDGAFNPGLFLGLSSVGYSMLRRVAPALPNPLIWG